MERIKKRRKKFSQEEKMEMVRLHYLEGVSHFGSAIRVNKNQSQKKRLTTHNSLKLLTRQLDSVVGHESDNQNQQITGAYLGYFEV